MRLGKASRKKPETRKRHVDARPVERRRRQDLEAGDAAGLRLPLRPHAHQRQRLRDIVAAGAHVGRAPGGERQPPWIGAVLLRMALDQELRRFPAELPGRRRRHGAAVERDRNCGRSAAPRAGRGSARPTAPAARSGRRARRAGRASSAAPQASTAGRSSRAIQSSTARRARPRALRRRLARHQAQRQQLQPLHRVAGAAPGSIARQRLGPRSGPGRAERRVERIETQAQIIGERADQRGLPRRRARAAGGSAPPADRQAARLQARGRRRAARRGSASP